MSDKLTELKIKKLLKEYEYLLIEDEYNENFISEYKPSFLKSIKEREIELGLREAEESIIVDNSDLEENKSSLSGDGKYTKLVHLWLENYCKAKKALFRNREV